MSEETEDLVPFQNNDPVLPGDPPEKKTAAVVSMIDIPSSVLAGVKNVAEVFYKSGLFKDTKSEAQAVVKILAGRELGIPPMEAMQEIYIIEGKVALSANLIAKKIRQSKKYDYEIVEMNGDLKDGYCVVNILRRVDAYQPPVIIGTSRFTMEDARKADLVKASGGWVKYTRNMLFARAITNARRWFCPDVASGYYTPDELGAEEDEEGRPITPQGPVLKRGMQVTALATSILLYTNKAENERLGALWANSDVTDADIEREIMIVAQSAGLTWNGVKFANAENTP